MPGDLGRPILAHQRSLAEDEPAIGTPPPAPDPAAAAEAERQRLAAAREAARASGVLVQLQGRRQAAPETQQEVEERPAPGTAVVAVPGAEGPRTGGPGQAGPLPDQGGGAPSGRTLSAGTVIPASLITGLDSDLPGTVLAQVTEHVRDTASGRTVLIPQGARLIGRYDSAVAFGQRRALLVWRRIVFPDGSSVALDDLPASDASGHAGIADTVDTHTWQLVKGIALSTLLGVGTELGLGRGESELVRAVREATQQNAARAGDQLVARHLEVRPTIRVRPGWPVRAVLHEDLVLAPWKG